MPKTPQVPEHWKEDYDEEPEEEIIEMEPEPPVIYEDKERDLLNDAGTERMDVALETDKKQNELDQELERLQQKKAERELKKQKKQQIKETKSEIRHLKYEPAYEAGEKIKGGMVTLGSKFGSLVAKKRGTPAQREARRAKTQMKMKKLAAVAKKKAVSFGKSMHEQRPGGGLQAGGKNVFATSGRSSGSLTGGGMGSGFLNSDFGSKILGNSGTSFFDNKLGIMSSRGGGSHTPRIMQGNLLGNNKPQASKGKKKQKAKPGLKLMSGRIKL